MTKKMPKELQDMMDHVIETITDHELEEAEVGKARRALLNLDEDEQMVVMKTSDAFRKLVNGKHIGVGVMAAAHALAVITSSTTMHEPAMGETLISAAFELCQQMREDMVKMKREEKSDA